MICSAWQWWWRIPWQTNLIPPVRYQFQEEDGLICLQYRSLQKPWKCLPNWICVTDPTKSNLHFAILLLCVARTFALPHCCEEIVATVSVVLLSNRPLCLGRICPQLDRGRRTDGFLILGPFLTQTYRSALASLALCSVQSLEPTCDIYSNWKDHELQKGVWYLRRN